jgi:hypothetical protein
VTRWNHAFIAGCTLSIVSVVANSSEAYRQVMVYAWEVFLVALIVDAVIGGYRDR